MNIFWAVVADAFREVANGAEEHRRLQRKDKRRKDHLIAVSRCRLALVWLNLVWGGTVPARSIRKIPLAVPLPRRTVGVRSRPAPAPLVGAPRGSVDPAYSWLPPGISCGLLVASW